MADSASSTGSSSSTTTESLAKCTAARIAGNLGLNEKSENYLADEILSLIRNVTKDILETQKQMDERWKASIRTMLERVIKDHLGG